jgi:hypothetical protein
MSGFLCGLPDPKGALFPTIAKGTGKLSAMALEQSKAHAMIRRCEIEPIDEGIDEAHGYRKHPAS